MSALTLKRRSLLPTITSNFFNGGSLLSPNFFDIDSDFLDFDIADRIPSVNIKENTKDFAIEMAVPGMEKEDFKISIENDMLNISSEKEEEKREENENYTRKEYAYNSFSRSFRLPENCLSDKIDAKYEKGILHVSIPKKEVTIKKTPKEIKVS